MLKDVRIPIENNILLGNVYKPLIDPKAWIIFSHGSGSSHFSSRNQKVAKNLLEHQFGSLLFDLLTLRPYSPGGQLHALASLLIQLRTNNQLTSFRAWTTRISFLFAPHAFVHQRQSTVSNLPEINLLAE